MSETIEVAVYVIVGLVVGVRFGVLSTRETLWQSPVITGIVTLAAVLLWPVVLVLSVVAGIGVLVQRLADRGR